VLRFRGLLELYGRATPRHGIDVCDGLRERPAMAAWILGAVLALAVGVVSRRAQDVRPVGCGHVMVSIGGLDANVDRVCRGRVSMSPSSVTISAASPYTSCTGARRCVGARGSRTPGRATPPPRGPRHTPEPESRTLGEDRFSSTARPS
jgi:hypothetical protein